MRAIICDRYGPPDILRIEEVERPVPARRIGDRHVVLDIPPHYRKQDLLLVKDLLEARKYRAVIDRRYPLEQVVEASRYVETEQKTGNVVLTVT